MDLVQWKKSSAEEKQAWIDSINTLAEIVGLVSNLVGLRETTEWLGEMLNEDVSADLTAFEEAIQMLTNRGIVLNATT